MLVDSVKCATLASGVVRIGLSYRNASGDEIVAGEIMIPAERFAGFVRSLADVGARLDGGKASRLA